MADSFERLRELNLSRDEVERIGEALKKPEFRQLLSEYVEELQDPENRKLYQEEVAALERQRGVDVTFIEPKPGYVIKTSVDGGQKGFVNVCSSEHVDKPSSAPAVREGARGLSWSVPHSLSHPREDVDNRGVRCRVFDVIFHPDTLHLADKNRTFRSMVNDTALEAVETNFDVRLDKKNLKFPKLAYKGMPHVSVIRTPSETKPQHTPEEKEFYDKIFAQADAQATRTKPKKSKQNSVSNVVEDHSEYTTPKYEIKHRTHIDMQEFTGHKQAKINAAIPKELVIEINLPLLKSSSDITLDVNEKLLQLTSEKPAKYKLNLTLPYSINESTGNAKFDKDLKKLIVTLPVKRTASIDIDSGVESDHPGSPQSEEEFVVKTCENSENRIESSVQFRTTNFLNENLHYSLPEFTCHVYENTIAFTINVKNVEESSVEKMFVNRSVIHVKFTSIGSSFYPCHYAFCVKLPSHLILVEESTIEVWDNNVVVQVPVESDEPITSYLYGIDEGALTEKFVETPEVINKILEEVEEVTLEKQPKQEEPNNNNELEHIPDSFEPQPDFADMAGTSYESSGDELSCGSSFSPRKGKGILKRFSSMRQTGRSISESSLDDLMCTSSFENTQVSLDSVIPEDGEVSTSLKKTVRFNNNVMKQLFRSNSSILGQKKKNQRKAQKKKRAMERRHSESEVSEGDEKKERDLNDWKKDRAKDQVINKKEDHEIFHLDIDN